MRWFLVTGYILFVIGLHVVPMGGAATLSSTGVGPLRADYLLHLVIFFPWMFFLPCQPKMSKVSVHRKWWGWLGLGIMLAAGAEVLQLWVPYRTFNPVDVVFNMAGVVVGGAGIMAVQKFIRREVL
jgi:glycopeptide antibiotics resistance protein